MNPGDRFDRYRVEGVLGRGGMGEVYVAYDEVLRRQVALKILHGSEPGAEARLLREARAAAAIDHVNAVRVFDVGELDGVAYLTMELLAGATLRARMSEPGVPRDEGGVALRYLARFVAVALFAKVLDPLATDGRARRFGSS